MRPIFCHPTESAASSAGEYIAQTQTGSRLCKPKNVAGRVEEVSKINNNGEDAPITVVCHRSLKGLLNIV